MTKYITLSEKHLLELQPLFLQCFIRPNFLFSDVSLMLVFLCMKTDFPQLKELTISSGWETTGC